MPRRYYSSTAVATTLSASANNSTTSITVTALSGYPAQFPYTAIIDPDTASEEVVTVTAASGTTLTVTRGSDGTSGVSHNAGAVFRHGVSARDFDEANAFVNGGGVANSLINAKGDLITGTADNTPAVQTVGANGQMLMADSGATNGLRYVDPPANRNLIINGAMQVSQRATSATGITGPAYRTADRWLTDFGAAATGAGTWTQTVENDAPTGSGFRKSIKMLCTTAAASPTANSQLSVQTRLEGQDLQRVRKGTSDALQLTASFWVKANVTGTYIVYLFDSDNTRIVSGSYSLAASATWERKTITFPADTTGAFNDDNGASLTLAFLLSSGSDYTSGTLQTTWGSVGNNFATGQTNLAAATNNYWQITGVQLEASPVATPFEFEPYEATLRKCQRYYQKSYNLTTAVPTNQAANYEQVISGNIANNTPVIVVPLKSRMRGSPTVTIYSYTSSTTSAISNLAGTDLAASSGTILEARDRNFSVQNASGGTITAASGGFAFHWAASAEL